MCSVTDAEPWSVMTTGGGAYTGPNSWRQSKPRVSGPESYLIRSTSPPIRMLNSDAGCSKTGKLKPDLAACELFPLTGLLEFELSFLLSRSPRIEPNELPPFLSFLFEIRLSVLSGVAVVLSALSPATSKEPNGIRQLVVHVGKSLRNLMMSMIRSTIVRSGPPARVENALAIEIRVTSSPPTRWLRSDSTGIGA